MSESSFHSAREDRETTAEPPIVDSNAHKKTNARHPAPQSKQRELESSPVVSKPERETQAKRSFDKKAEKAEQKPEQKQKEAKPAPKPAPKPAQNTRAAKPQPRQQPEPEPESSPQPEPRSESVEIPKSSPAKTPATQPRAQRHEEEEENYDDGDREDMELDGLDDIGSPSDGSTPERPPIRKSSLTFASLPAREPLKKSLGPRMSRTSHIDVGKINGTGNSGVLGRQTGGHRTTQAGLDEQAQGDKMDVDDAGASREYGEDETRASKLHNKSSTQRLHEKISMLGKLQPSRPTKSIPNVSNLSSAHVSYPELPSVNNKADGKPDTANRGSREMPAGDPMATDEDEWIKPLNTPQRPNLAKSQTFDVADKSHKASDRRFERDTSAARDHSMDEDRPTKPTENLGGELYRKSTTPVHSPPKRPMHQKSASVFNTAGEVSTTPIGSPRHQDVPLSASKWKLQSIMKSAKGLFSSTGGVSNAARVEASSPDESREPPAVESSTPTKSEGRETRGSAEREEKRKQKELEDRQRAEEAEREEKAREQQEKQKAAHLKAAQEKASQEQEREASAPSPKRIPQLQKQPSKEPEPATETNASASTSTKSGIPPPASSQQTQQKQNERRPVKPTREPLQKPKPQPVSIRVGSALSRQIPMAPGSNVQESSAPTAPTPASASKPAAPPSTLKKKASNNSLHTVPSNSSFKSSVSSTSQRKAQLASERKKEQEEREARRKEEQKREVERKRAAQQQQQEEARRQEMRSRAEAEKRDRERQVSEDPKKAAHMQAIEKRRLENARRLERQGSQQPSEPERPASQASRPASRLGSVQPFNRSVNQPQPNPAKPPKRAMDDEPSNRPAPSKPSAVQPSGETKRRRTEDEHNPPPSVRPTMAPPIRQSTIRKVSLPPLPSFPIRELSILTSFPGTQKAVFGRPQQALDAQQRTSLGPPPVWLFYFQDRTAAETSPPDGHVEVRQRQDSLLRGPAVRTQQDPWRRQEQFSPETRHEAIAQVPQWREHPLTRDCHGQRRRRLGVGHAAYAQVGSTRGTRSPAARARGYGGRLDLWTYCALLARGDLQDRQEDQEVPRTHQQCQLVWG